MYKQIDAGGKESMSKIFVFKANVEENLSVIDVDRNILLLLNYSL